MKHLNKLQLAGYHVLIVLGTYFDVPIFLSWTTKISSLCSTNVLGSRGDKNDIWPIRVNQSVDIRYSYLEVPARRPYFTIEILFCRTNVYIGEIVTIFWHEINLKMGQKFFEMNVHSYEKHLRKVFIILEWAAKCTLWRNFWTQLSDFTFRLLLQS